LLAACSDSRCEPLAEIVELAWETACRRSEIVDLLRWSTVVGRREPQSILARYKCAHLVALSLRRSPHHDNGINRVRGAS
jgi:hypothetical protein